MARCTRNDSAPTPLTLADLQIGDTFAFIHREVGTQPDRFMLTDAGIVCTRGGAAGRVTVHILDINARCEVVDVFRAGLRVLPKPAKATYTLTLSQDEAQAVRNVMGAMTQECKDVFGETFDVYRAMDMAGLENTVKGVYGLRLRKGYSDLPSC